MMRSIYMIIEVVQSGDTVYSIAESYGVSVQKLISDNGLNQDGALVVGQSLVILFPDEVYTAQSAVSVEQIAEQNGVSSKTIYRNNIFLKGAPNVHQGSGVVISYEQPPTLSKFLGGYAYDFIDQTLLNTVVHYMTYIMPFTYGFRADGSLIAPDDERKIKTALNASVRPLMQV